MKIVIQALLAVVLLIVSSDAISQDSPQYSYKGPIAYFELWGSNFHHSVNIEHVIKHNKHSKVNLRVGFISRNLKASSKFWSVPITLQVFNRTASTNHAEAGIGFNYIQGARITDTGSTSKTLVLTPSVGYRYQKPDGGIFFKILYTPGYIIKEFERFGHPAGANNGGLYHSIGISLGYFFSREKS